MLDFLLPLLIAASFISLSQAEVKITSNADPPEKFFEVGQNIELTCKGGDNWSRPKVPDWADAPELTARQELTKAEGGAVSKLIFDPIKSKDGGSYICKDNATQKTDTFQLNVISEDSIVTTNVAKNGSLDVTLHCYQRFSQPFPVIWYHPNGSEVVSTNIVNKQDKNYVIKDSKQNYDLVMSSEYRFPAKMGDYRCRLNATGTPNLSNDTIDKLNNIEKTVTFAAKPDVKIQGSGKSKSAIKGEKFELNCTVQGHEKNSDHIKWVHVNDETHVTTVLLDVPWSELTVCEGTKEEEMKKCCQASENCNATASRFFFTRDKVFEDYTSSPNHSSKQAQNFISSLLVINEVQEEDRGDYTCSASNVFGEASSTVAVRVKDRLAALWPFIGIVIEVIVLCAIIFVCERRRSKTVEEEDETEPMKGEEKDNRDSSVRSRK